MALRPTNSDEDADVALAPWHSCLLRRDLSRRLVKQRHECRYSKQECFRHVNVLRSAKQAPPVAALRRSVQVVPFRLAHRDSFHPATVHFICLGWI
jgi:hypothetical protein